MKNVKTERKGDNLIIIVDVSKKTIENSAQSKSGKNKLVASTSGFIPVPDTDVRMNLSIID